MNRSAGSKRNSRIDAAAVKIAALLVAALVLVSLNGGPPATTAQLTGGTPVPAVDCGPPEPVPMAASPVATPFVSAATATAAAPMPSADSRTSLSVSRAVTKLAACWNAQRWSDALALAAPSLLATWLGSADQAAAPALFARLAAAGLATPITVESVIFVRASGSGVATAEVTWRQGNARHFTLWRFADVSGVWMLDGFEQLEVNVAAGAVGIAATFAGGGLELSRGAVVNPGAIAIDVTNRESSTSSVAVLAMPAGVDLGALISGNASAGTSGVSLLGYLPVAAGSTGRLVLVDLAPGDYVVVAGLEQVALGTLPALAITTLTVEPTTV